MDNFLSIILPETQKLVNTEDSSLLFIMESIDKLSDSYDLEQMINEIIQKMESGEEVYFFYI